MVIYYKSLNKFIKVSNNSNKIKFFSNKKRIQKFSIIQI